MSKNNINFKVLVCLTIFSFIFSNISFSTLISPIVGQQISHPDLNKAVRLFEYEGKYAEAALLLKELIEENALSGAELIIAYEYLARSHYKLDNFDAAEKTYIEVLRLNPKHAFDPAYVPPDQISFFAKVKGKVLTSVTIRSIPTKAKVFWDNKPCEKETSLTLHDVIIGEHKLRVEKGIEYIPCDTLVTVISGRMNEFNIELIPKPPEIKVSKPFYKKWWVSGLGAAVVGGIVVALTRGKEGGEGPKPLPGPPPPPGK